MHHAAAAAVIHNRPDGWVGGAPIPDLDADAERRLFRAMRRVLEESIGFGARPERAPGSYLLGHREEGADCPGRCGGTVERITVSGRAGYCCPACQPPPG